MDVKHIHENSAKRVHSELVKALGTENKPDQWLHFMRAAKHHLEFLFESGRPTKAQIQSSSIGALGFSSWGEMIEAPVVDNGLGWSINTWKLWSKAFKVVESYPYLAKMDFKPSGIMTLHKNLDGDLPATAAELKGRQAEVSRAMKADRDEKAELKERVRELEVKLSESNAQIDILTSQFAEFKSVLEKNAELKNKIEVFDRDLEKKCLEVEQLKTQNKNLSAEAEKFKLELDDLESEITERYEEKLKNAGFLSRLKYLFMR